MKQAIWNNTVIAEVDDSEAILIEGNVYFPPSSIKKEFFQPSDMNSTCHWKGEASYYNIVIKSNNGEELINENAAWYYPNPKEGSIPMVGKDFSNYVGFWRGVVVK